MKNLFRFSSEFTHIGYTSTLFTSSDSSDIIFGSDIGPYLLSTENFNELKKEYPKEYQHLDNWEQLYDKSKFAEQLEKMIKNHDANHGITWLTIEEYLYQCRKE